jgi:hypothetical protein
MKWKLINQETRREVKEGDIVRSTRGDAFTYESGRPPQSEGSSGHVYVRPEGAAGESSQHQYYPSVIGCKWVLDEANLAPGNLKNEVRAIHYKSGETVDFAFIEKAGKHGYRGFFKHDLKMDGTPNRTHRGTFISNHADQFAPFYVVQEPERERVAAPLRATITELEKQVAELEKELLAIYQAPKQEEVAK